MHDEADDLAVALARIAETAEAVAEHVERGPITPTLGAREIRERLATRFDFAKPMALDDVVREVVALLDDGIVHVTHPRYFGLFNPSVTPAAVVGDATAAAYNPQLAAWSHAPAANEIERFTLESIMERFGFDPSSSAGTFTSGGAEANLTAVVAALTHAFPTFPSKGLRSLSRDPVFFVSEESHHSMHKAARMVGLGHTAVRTVPANHSLRMDPDALSTLVAEERAAGRDPFMVVGTAGSTSLGVVDPLRELAAVCREHGLWFHVDAAWGGAAALSPKLREHLAGIELAESITCDAHKWLSVPMAGGMLFCRHPDVLRAAFDVSTPYMPVATTDDVVDPFAVSVQWSRRFIGLKLFVSLAERGLPGYAAMIEHQAEMADVLREELLGRDWQVVNDTPLPLVCFTRDGLDAKRVLGEMLTKQVAWMSIVPIHGRDALRACITSFRTEKQDIVEVIDELTRLAGEDRS